jgi:predicted CopG family antitoxin
MEAHIMKSIIIHMDDKEYELLQEIKGENTWKEMLMTLIRTKKEIKDEVF